MHIEVEPGMIVREDVVDGVPILRVTRSTELLTKTIAFRLSASDYVAYAAFLEAFPRRQWAEAFRWLINQPEVIDVMRRKLADATSTASP